MESEPPEITRLARLALSDVFFRSQPRVLWSDAQGQHSRLIDGRVIVGAAPSSGIVVADNTVSRVHAEFEGRENELWVRDLGSKNGTYVEGLQVTGARVPDKGKIRIGSTEFLVSYDESDRVPVEVWQFDTFGKLVGDSMPMRQLFATLARISPMDASVLVHGETGTGKELVARAIHDASHRREKPFVVVDCAALPENLLDAELFGHARGAFTGAVGARTGAIEAAEGGTVFLDEIGELPIPMQPKLLRVLESRMVRRVGESTYRDVDVRFISATHRDLLRMVGAGEFREDLYFRLSVIPVEVPPLRERINDIEILVKHFLRRGGFQDEVDPQLLRELTSRPWRGNVRELRNFVDRARALGTREALAMSPTHPVTDSSRMEAAAPAAPTGSMRPPAGRPPSVPSIPVPPPDALPVGLRADDPKMFDQGYKDFRESWIDAGEKEYVRRLLTRHNRNVAAAAREADVDRTYIYRLIRKHEL